MIRRALTSRTFLELTLALLLVWLWHTSALLSGIEQYGEPQGETARAGLYLQAATDCSLCLLHRHSPSSTDHSHEPPSITAMFRLPTRAGDNPLLSSRYQALPDRPNDLIERPPRAV